MPQYYFDLRDSVGLAVDEEGVELGSIDDARQEAARALADMASEAIATGIGKGEPAQQMASKSGTKPGRCFR